MVITAPDAETLKVCPAIAARGDDSDRPDDDPPVGGAPVQPKGPNPPKFPDSGKHLSINELSRSPEMQVAWYGYRFYDPVTGRWPSRDPIEEEGGVNVYSYLFNDPWNWFEYLGLEPEKPELVTPKTKAPDVFKGFEDERYQKHDALILELVVDFNLHKKKYCGCNETQFGQIPDLTTNFVKSWLIQETGGSDKRSRAAWEIDPAQVNVPGDWTNQKEALGLGLKEPKTRNTGDIRTNLKAALMFLCRKGIASSAAPGTTNPGLPFRGWIEALKSYNGRNGKTTNGKAYKKNYADQISDRANNPDKHVQIELPKPTKK
jgi:RHS repeat-associated protein